MILPPRPARFLRLVAAALLLLPASPALSQDPQQKPILIGILQEAASFNLGADGEWTASDPETGRKKKFGDRTAFLIKERGQGVEIGGHRFGDLVRASPEAEDSCIRVNGKRYRGTIIVRRRPGGRFTVIDELSLDDYVRGVLPLEVSASWPQEALKAQAVVSRTFALRNLGKHASEGFDLCSRVDCQVYGGRDAEQESTDRAVEATRGEVVLYRGELADTVFFSNCGGRTEDPRGAWDAGFAPPYLKPVRCRYCRKEKHYRWERTLSQSQIAQALEKAGADVGTPIRSMKVASRTRSGRAQSFAFRGRNGWTRVRAGRFRMCVGPDLLRSTLITRIRRVRGGFELSGRGWGHGVGLCQEGARVMAARGKSYKKIIRFYYRGARVSSPKD